MTYQFSCERCGSSFQTSDHRRRFCGRSCAQQFHAGNRDINGSSNPNWRGGKRSHPLYAIHSEMIGRCHRQTHPRYADYGGRGIAVCERWANDFWAFVEDVGERPADPKGWNGERPYWSLDRIDNDDGYTPANVRWANPYQQAGNRRVGDSCPNGHPYTPTNTGRYKEGWRKCLICYRRNGQKSNERRKRS